jgi:pyruvate dehydrogenase E2 component (dihydrolipoamide acetyltransferase)
MAKEVFIPKLGQTMETATLSRWLVADGEKVEQGQEILEVETDKAVFAVEAAARGHLHIGPFKPGDVVPVLQVVAIIGKPEDKFEIQPNENATPGAAGQETVPPTAAAQVQAPKENGKVFASPRARKLAGEKGIDLALVTPTGGGGQRIAERDILAFLAQAPRATPVAQRLAAEVGLDLRTLTGTGPGKRITKEDVERANRPVQSPAAQPPGVSLPLAPEEVLERVPLKGIRGIIAERMGASVHTTARVTLFMEADATEFVDMRVRLKASVEKDWGFAPGYNDLLAKIVALALRQFPYMNARLAPDSIERLAHINLGMAVDTDRGLLVPVIRDADQKSLRQFGGEFRELVGRAQTGKSLPDDLTGGTFTITNLGMYDVLAFTPVINLPEAAILGVGAITPQPAVRDGAVVVRQMTILSLVFDHRLVDGAPAAQFLQYIKNLIEEPYLWVTAQS